MNEGRWVIIERGQFIFGRNAAEKELKIDGMKVYRVLQKYEELEQVKISEQPIFTRNYL